MLRCFNKHYRNHLVMTIHKIVAKNPNNARTVTESHNMNISLMSVLPSQNAPMQNKRY